jgi:WD40 repeat protein
VTLYDVRRQRPIKSFEPHTDPVWGLAFTPDDKTLVTTSWDGTIKFSSVANYQQMLTLAHGGGPVYWVTFSPDGNLMATCSTDTTVRLWPAPSLAEIDAAEKQAQR